MKIVMGIDPSVASTGYAVYSNGEIVEVGTVKTNSKVEEEHRLKKLYDEIYNLITEWQVSKIIMEDQFVGKNAKTSLYLSRARGVIMLACSQKNVEVEVYAPSEIKKCITGKGNAKKELVQERVLEIYNQDMAVKEAFKNGFKQSGKYKNDDISDALAIIKTYELKSKV